MWLVHLALNDHRTSSVPSACTPAACTAGASASRFQTSRFAPYRNAPAPGTFCSPQFTETKLIKLSATAEATLRILDGSRLEDPPSRHKIGGSPS